MGVYVTLSIMPYKIDPARWSEVYEETITLLKAGNTMGFKVEDLGFAKKMYYSREFERHNEDKAKRHWYAVGDFESKKRAESFIMYYDLNYYRKRNKEDMECKNEILYDMASEENNHITVFNEKTQGEPYHYTILAIASLIESRFPNFAITQGNIDMGQAKKAVSWANSILKKKIDIPLCTTSEKLFKRLKKYFKGRKLISIFRKFFLGNHDEFYRTIFKNTKRDVITEWFTEELKYYNSPGQIGASHLISYWLKETEDMELLCKIACLDKNGPKFDPIDFVNSTCSGFTEKEKTKELLDFFKKPEGAADTVHRQFGSIFLALSLKGKNAEWYIEKEKILEAFYSSFPELKEKIEEIVNSKLKSATKEDMELQKNKIEVLKNVFMEDSEENNFDDGEIFNEVKNYDSLGEKLKLILRVIACRIKELKKDIISEYSEHLKEITPDGIRKEIIKLIDKIRHIMITEDGWNWIDKENDTDMLFILLSFGCIKEMELTFCNTRRAVFENRDLCLILRDLMNNKEVMKETKKWIRDNKKDQ